MKKIIALTLCVLLALSFVGCGKAVDVLKKPAKTTEKLVDLVEKDVDNVIETFDSECEKLTKKIKNYKQYKNNVKKVKEFYTTVVEEAEAIAIRFQKYSINYAELIVNSDVSSSSMYRQLTNAENYLDNNLTKVCDKLEVSVDKANNHFDKILDDAYYDDLAGAEDYLDDEDYMWDTTCENIWDVEDAGGDFIFDLYDAVEDYVDDGNIATAKNIISKYRDRAGSLYNGIASSVSSSSSTNNNSNSNSTQVVGVRSNVKAAIDSYEKFMNEYIDFMKTFMNSSGTDYGLISQYYDYLEEYEEVLEAFEDLENEELNSAELAYYSQVQARVAQKLATIY